MSEEKVLNKLESKILEEFPEASAYDAMILSGFVALYCLAPPQVKEFLSQIIKNGLNEAKEINKASMKNIQSQIDSIKEGIVKITN